MTASIAVVGCGYWGSNLVRNFSELGALRAVVDAFPATADRVAQQYGVEALSFEQAIAHPEIAGVAIAAPAELHAKLVIEVLGADKHVFVEKPLALNERDGLAIKAAAEKAGKTLMIGHLLQYHPAFATLLKMVRDGELGELRYAYSNRLSLGKFRVEENALWSFAPHDLSMLLALFDEEPIEVVGSGGAYVTPGIDDFSRVDLTFSGGRKAHAFASWLHPFKEHRLVVVGSRAMAVFEDSLAGADKLRLFRHEIDTSGREPAGKKAEAEPIAYPTGKENEPLRLECQHFIDCVAGVTQPRTGADEALRVLRALIQADPNSNEQHQEARRA